MIRQKDLKLLWGRAAGKCSICRTQLAHELASSKAAIQIGEQAHIVAEEPGGPRGESLLTSEQRNSYANLILVCPTCHAKIDHQDGRSEFPIERLHLLKTQHEEWVREQLSDIDEEKEDLPLLVYAHIVDTLVDFLDLSRWSSWVGFAASSHKWPDDFDMRAYEIAHALHTTLWPGRLPELELATKASGHITVAAFELFHQHCRSEGNYYVADDFYRMPNSPHIDNALLEEHRAWSQSCTLLLYEATAAVNWFADVVRRELNPRFFLLEGRFALREVTYPRLEWGVNLYEYDDETRPTDAAGIELRVTKMRARYDDLLAKRKSELDCRTPRRDEG